MTIKVHDSSNIKWETIEKFRKLHIKEAKRETRSINTWRKQFDAIYTVCINIENIYSFYSYE